MKTIPSKETVDFVAKAQLAPRVEPTWKVVIRDMEQRNEMGEKKYGVMLNPSTEENMLQHLYEELLDAAVYIKTEIIKRG